MTKKNGEILKVTVVATEKEEIKYRIFGDPNGPVQTIPKSELLKVTLENGFVYEKPFSETEMGQAMTKKGNTAVSGKAGAVLSINADKTGNLSINSISVTPSFAHFVANNFAIGLNSGILFRSIPQDVGKSQETQLMLMPSFLCYAKVQGSARPYFQAGAGVATLHTRHEPTDFNIPDQAYSGPCAFFGFGVACFIREDLSFDFDLSYTWVKLTNNSNKSETGKTGTIGSSLGFSFFL